MKRHFYQLDVFTDKPLEGNPLAVITDGDGLSPRKMQAIAREMNLSETVFVQRPTGNRALARLRIFTTKAELPLAGHPVIGTWFLLAELGVVPAQEPGPMNSENKRGGSSFDRRHLLQAGLAAAFAAPLGAFGAAQAFAPQALEHLGAQRCGDALDLGSGVERQGEGLQTRVHAAISSFLAILPFSLLGS